MRTQSSSPTNIELSRSESEDEDEDAVLIAYKFFRIKNEVEGKMKSYFIARLRLLLRNV